MSKTSRWIPDRWDKGLAVRQGRDNWKQEAREEMEDMGSDSVFVIINEWTPEGSEYDLREIVDNKYFEDEDEAWGHLSMIAQSMDIELDFDDSSLDVPSPFRQTGIESESYYTEELNRG